MSRATKPRWGNNEIGLTQTQGSSLTLATLGYLTELLQSSERSLRCVKNSVDRIALRGLHNRRIPNAIHPQHMPQRGSSYSPSLRASANYPEFQTRSIRNTCPKGALSYSPGLRASASYPGETDTSPFSLPQRGFVMACRARQNPVGAKSASPAPRVAR